MSRRDRLVLLTCSLAVAVCVSGKVLPEKPWVDAASGLVYENSLVSGKPNEIVDTAKVPRQAFYDPEIAGSQFFAPYVYGDFPSYPSSSEKTPSKSKKSSSSSKSAKAKPFAYGAPYKRDVKNAELSDEAALIRERREAADTTAAHPNLGLSIDETGKSKTDSTGSVPTQYLAGIYSPYAIMMDPSMYMSKKSAFLDTLFNNLATSTPAPTTTEAPVPKSTIVPPSFWVPVPLNYTVIDYNAKVAEFLSKLFDSLKANKTGIAKTSNISEIVDSFGESSGRPARSLQDISTLTEAKDTIVDTVLTELIELKDDIISTANGLATYAKTATSPATPGKPFKPFASTMWSKPTVDPTLVFQQRIAVLDKVFNMLTDLQRNITTNVQAAIKNNASPSESETPAPESSYGNEALYNDAQLDTLKKNLYAAQLGAFLSRAIEESGGKVARDVKDETLLEKRNLPHDENQNNQNDSEDDSETSVSDVKDEGGLERRDVSDDDLYYQYLSPANAEENDEDRNRRQHTRAVNMQMHQGYQSLPDGAIETVQAGGGTVPGHQGGGIKLLDIAGSEENQGNEADPSFDWIDWVQYITNERQRHRHRHDRH